MGKKSIVITTIEEKLSSYGFHYNKYECGRWTFSRDVEGISQNVFVQKGMWGNDYYILEINTSASQAPLRVHDITKDARYNNDFFEFHSEEERRKVLETMADIVIQYGIDIMNELNVIEERYDATQEMHKKLFQEHDLLVDKFLERHGISNLEEEAVLPVIQDEWQLVLQAEYKEIQDKLVELAAVYGTMLMKRVGGRWRYSKLYKSTDIEKMPIFVTYPVLDILVQLWVKKEVDSVTQRYKKDVMIFLQWVAECRQAYGPDWQPPSLTK